MYRLAIRRPVATTMTYLILVVIGLVSLVQLPIDLLPKVEFTQLTVRVRWPNVGPREIEQIITDRIENAVAGLPNLERMTSTSEEGTSRVRLEFGRGTNVEEAANDLRSVLDRLRDDLPEGADAPEILKLDLDAVAVLNLAATTTRDLAWLTLEMEENLARRFEQVPGVGSITVWGGIRRAVLVDLDRARLEAAGLTALDVREAIARENATLPGGNVRAGMSDILVRTVGEYTSVEEIAATFIPRQNGSPVRVRDIASVTDGHEDLRNITEINGVPSVALSIQKQSGANTVAVARELREEAARINDERDDIHLTILSDQSEFIRQSIDSVRSGGLWGALLAIVVLWFFLRSRSSTAIIALSIPISVIATFGLLAWGDQTLNQMTFGGLALGVGLMVDNAIVVLESIVRRREENGDAPEVAALGGTASVAGAITASTLTTCIIFLPIAFARTTSGALFQALAIVVVFSLACSLFVALSLVPVLASRFLHVDPPEQRKRSRIREGLERLEGAYGRLLKSALGRKGIVFAVTGALLAVALLLFGRIPVELAPHVDADEIDVQLEMAQGTSISVMNHYIAELETRVLQVLPSGSVDVVSTEVRGGDAEVELKLAPADERAMSSSALADLLRRELVGVIPGSEIRVRAAPGLWILRRIFSAGGGAEDLELQLRSWDLAAAEEVASELVRRLEVVPGFADVRSSRREGQPEENLVLHRERMAALGLTVDAVGRAVQASLGGVEAGSLRHEGTEHPILVRLAPEDRLTSQDVGSVVVRTPSGAIVPLSAFTERRVERSPLEIQRVDGQRVTHVTADLAEGLALGDAVELVREVVAGMTMPDGVAISFGGEYEEQQEARRDFLLAIMMALALVYMVMAAQFERFLDPLVIMLAVPMSLVGVVPALLLTGTTLNIQSVMGLVILVGIVVNNAIVLVEAINEQRREYGKSVEEAVAEAGRLRLRPILMTTSTTTLALLPLAIGIGPGSEIQAPLARVVIGGLTASALVTLLLVPAAYVAATSWVDRIRARRRAS